MNEDPQEGADQVLAGEHVLGADQVLGDVQLPNVDAGASW